MTEFTSGEKHDIRAMYREAKYPEAQIGVMAQLYACSKNDILAVLGLEAKAAVTPQAAARKAHGRRPLHSEETRQSAVRLVLEEGLPHRDAASRVGVSQTTVSKWVREEKARQAPGVRPQAAPEPVASNSTKAVAQSLPEVAVPQEAVAGTQADAAVPAGQEAAEQAMSRPKAPVPIKAPGGRRSRIKEAKQMAVAVMVSVGMICFTVLMVAFLKYEKKNK